VSVVLCQKNATVSAVAARLTAFTWSLMTRATRDEIAWIVATTHPARHAVIDGGRLPATVLADVAVSA
jgi:hypothetical protein